MTTIIADRAALLDTMTLAFGAHDPDSGQMCAMEAAAYIAGEPWSDHPQGVSPVIAAFLRSWNDALPEPTRTTLLRPLLPLVIGTRTTEADEETRAWMAMDWLVRVQTPAWLRLAGLTEHAQWMESLARIADATLAGKAQPTITAAWSAARSAARLAAWSAARLAAVSAARLAAVSAAESAAWAAARSAARLAAWSAARSAVESAARAAVESAAESAVDNALAPTVATLQASACELVREMCAVGRTPTPHAGGTDA